MPYHNPNKRPRIDDSETPNPAGVRNQRNAFLNSISRSITPPRSTRKEATEELNEPVDTTSVESSTLLQGTQENSSELEPNPDNQKLEDVAGGNVVPSPFKLTRIRNLSENENLDTVSLHEILGNPLIKEAWVFNFCFDVDWMMNYFDPDVQRLVQVKLVHGSWRKEDGNRVSIEDACKRWSNVESICAYIPDPFGTHHSKMFVLFTHDDQAEVVIHTANILKRDWTNMTQAVWRSQLLPKLTGLRNSNPGPIGSGSRFQHDLSSYLRAYGKKLQNLVNQIQQYDFDSVRGAIVASVPSKVKKPADFNAEAKPLWGHLRLQQVLSAIEKRKKYKKTPRELQSPHLIWQISSIATLSPAWLEMFCEACFQPDPSSWENVSVIFPTSTNVRISLDGYESGVSIHTKAQSNAHLKQISGMRKQLHQWTKGAVQHAQAGRDEAAPHIKTYIRFKSKPTSENATPDIDWVLLTSANLSTQAWGSIPKVGKESKDDSELLVQVQSFELGVMFWPELFADNFNTTTSDESKVEDSNRQIRMTPVFGKDLPEPLQSEHTTVGIRIPYDLPLTPYGANELPWSSHSSHHTPDRHGRKWRS